MPAQQARREFRLRGAPGFSALCLLLAASADAAGFRFDADDSELRFTGNYGGEPVPGVFRRFSGEVEFDPAAPLATRFRTEIDIASLDTDYADRDDTLRAPEFFDSSAHPTAVWQSDGACTATGARLSCPGRLMLKGRTHPVVIDIAIAADGRTIEGKATLDRSRFDIGAGEWADPQTIATAVQVAFRLRLQP
ncbi:MAG: YceI family protein [Xanthomonadales bacterium PRO6]|nr:YceI family protein [Xanthomonadales bacterium PRO6]